LGKEILARSGGPRLATAGHGPGLELRTPSILLRYKRFAVPNMLIFGRFFGDMGIPQPTMEKFPPR
jgi:hypothetical protein